MERLPTGTKLGHLNIIEVYKYYDGPKLFACSNAVGQFYLAFWLGDEKEVDRWLYVPISDTRLNLARSGGISLKDVCLIPEDGWVWLIELPLYSDIPITLESVEPSKLASNDLPADDSFLNISTHTLPIIDESAMLRATRTMNEVIDLSLKDEKALRSEIPASTLGTALVNFQELLSSILYAKAGYTSRKGRVPEYLKRYAQLNAVGIFDSSFGIRLESQLNQRDLFSDTEHAPTPDLPIAIDEMISLIYFSEKEDELIKYLEKRGGRVTARYAALLTSLVNSKTNIKATWASPKRKDKKTISLDWGRAQDIVKVLLTTIEEITETFKIKCRLDGIDVYRKTFDLVNLHTDERLSGRILEAYFEAAKEAAAKVPAYYYAIIEQSNEIISATGETKEKYSLIKLEEEE